MAKRMILKLSVFVFLLAAFSAIGSAAVVYVATDGSGDYNCDGINDDVEINKALAYVASNGGGTVYLKNADTYVIGNTIKIGDNTILTGNSGAVIKLEDNAYFSDWQPMIENSGSVGNIKIHGFEIDGNYANNDRYVKGYGHYGIIMRFQRIDNIEIYDMYMHDTGGDLTRFDYCSGVSVHDSVGRYQGHEFANFYVCDDIQVYNNDMSIAVNAGVRCEMTDNIVIHDNEIYAETSSGYVGIYVQSFHKNYPVTSVEIYNNVIHDTMYAGIYLLAFDNGGTYDLTDKSQACNANIYNNVIYNTGRKGTAPGGGISTAGFHNTVIENNVIYDVNGNGISILYNKADATYTGVEYFIRNNIIMSSSGYGIQNYESSTHTVTAEYNDVYSNSAGTHTGSGITYTNNLNANPYFANAGNDDFHLMSAYGRWSDGSWVTDSTTSTLVDAGDPDSDYSRETANGGRINIGAYGNTAQASRSNSVEDVVEEPVVEEPVVDEPVVEDPISSGDDGIIENPVPTTGELNIQYGTATIDGDLSEWNNAGELVFNGDSGRSSSLENSVSAKAMYDDTYLYVAYDVTDTDLRTDGSRIYYDDSIELYIDTLHNHGTAMQTDDYHLIISIEGDIVHDVGTGTAKDYSYVIDVTQAIDVQGSVNDASDVDDGYTIELAIPWDDIGGQPAVDVVGVLFAVNECDIDGTYLLNSCDLPGSYAVPDNWGDAAIVQGSGDSTPDDSTSDSTTSVDLVISDISADSGKIYVEDTLGVGKLYYIDRSYEFTSVPSSYAGLSYIMTSTKDRYYTQTGFLEFDVNQDVTVYVAYDDRTNTQPSWLSSFTDTGDDLVRDSSVAFSIYSRDYSAGHIALDGNSLLSNEDGGMYVVIVKPAGSSSATATPVTSSGSPVISGISVASNKEYVEDILGVGKLYYIDRNYEFTSVSSSYAGLSYIMTSTKDRYYTQADFLEFDVNQDVTVYVAYDDRTNTQPSWLSSFTDTGDDLVRDSSVTFSIYSRAYPAGHIALDGNSLLSGEDGGMYVVIVK